jgi:D-glycero-D-manno-heptose 1,7-bisphosphate phosphatase
VTPALRPAVFLDRDGTIIEEMGYLVPGVPVHLYPFAARAIAKLANAGFAVVVVTNQGGIALGMYDHAFVDETHAALDGVLAAAGAPVARWYFCPHHPKGSVPAWTGACECRKPEPGMVERASRELQVDLARSWVVGDQWRDVELARRAGARGILVRTGHGASLEHEWPDGVERPPVICDDLDAAAEHILAATAPTDRRAEH